MAPQISVDIMTPERLVLQVQAEAVVVPAVEGELGILPGHAPLLAQLQAGQIRIRHEGRMELFAVSGGFIEVADNRVAIFAETAEMAGEIDVERARQAAERARQALKAPGPQADLSQAEATLRRALARLRAAESIRRRPSAQK